MLVCTWENLRNIYQYSVFVLVFSIDNTAKPNIKENNAFRNMFCFCMILYI